MPRYRLYIDTCFKNVAAGTQQKKYEQTEHVRCGITTLPDNNIIERYHGPYRERDKITRAIDNNDMAQRK